MYDHAFIVHKLHLYFEAQITHMTKTNITQVVDIQSLELAEPLPLPHQIILHLFLAEFTELFDKTLSVFYDVG